MAAAAFALQLQNRVDAATAAADRAEQQRTSICAKAAPAGQSFNQMETTASAQAYMKVALLAVQAEFARNALDQATQKAAAARQAVADADAALHQTTARQNQAHNHQVAAEGYFLPDDPDQGNEDILVNPANAAASAPLILQNAKAATNQIEPGLTAAKPIACEQPGPPGQPPTPSHGARAIDAAKQSSKTLNTAVKAARIVATAAQGFPPAPASCSQPAQAQYAQLIQDLLAPDRLPAVANDCNTVTARSGTLLASVAGPTQTVRNQAVAMGQLSQRLDDLKRRDIYARPENEVQQNVARSRKLARDADTLATNVQAAADAVVQALNPMDQEADQVVTDTQALRARLVAIRQLAHDAAALIPYDPAANSAAAKGALDEAESAEREMQVLVQGVQQATAVAQIPANLAATAKAELEEELKAAWNTARVKAPTGTARDTVIGARDAARQGLDRASVVMTQCGLPEGKKRRQLDKAMADVISVQGLIANLVPQAQAAQQAIAAQVTRTQQAQAQAQVCLDAAKASADQAVDRRIEQLQAEGHGPQRHEGGPSTQVLAQRATYAIDPETHTQLDVEGGGIHEASETASKFKTKAIYVKAEALARAARPADRNEATVPLSRLGPNVAEGMTCPARPGTSDVLGGEAITIPVLTQAQIDQRHQARVAALPAGAPLPPPPQAYVYDGTQPPPNLDQMDQAAMAAKIAADTRPEVYAPNAEAFAVLRTDTHGKVYLRTMWPQNPA